MFKLPSRYCFAALLSLPLSQRCLFTCTMGHHDSTTRGTLTLEQFARELGIDSIELPVGNFFTSSDQQATGLACEVDPPLL
jgi:hypothetical protein